MEILLAIALGALLRDPVFVNVDPTYTPGKGGEHEKTVKKVAAGSYSKTQKVGDVAGRGAAASAAFFTALGRGAADRWKSRKKPADKTPAPGGGTPAQGQVPDTFRPAPPQVVFVPMPPSTPPTVGIPRRPETPPAIPKQPGPADEEGTPKLRLVKDDPNKPNPEGDEKKPAGGESGEKEKPKEQAKTEPGTETKPEEKTAAKNGDKTPADTTSPVRKGTSVATEVHFNQLVGFLRESTTRTRDDEGIARFVFEDDQRLANLLDNMANQAEGLKAGKKIAAAIDALRQQVAMQAKTADEYRERCHNMAEKAATANRNIQNRYDGMARSAAEMSEGPAYSSYYQEA